MKILISLFFSLPLIAAEINTLSPEEKADGWQMLFNGQDLTNWRIYGSTAKPLAGWKIEEGILKKLQGIPGGNIITKRKYNDFTLIWEWKITKNGNNGIKYLVTEERKNAPGPEFQILDDNGHPDSKKGAIRQTGALYDIFPPVADKYVKPIGEWNRSRIIVQGKHVEHWINGSRVLEYDLESTELLSAIAKSKFSRVKDFGKKIEGHIMLTDHIDECSFRNMKIRTEIAK